MPPSSINIKYAMVECNTSIFYLLKSMNLSDVHCTLTIN